MSMNVERPKYKESAIQFFSVILTARQQGASIRSLARLFGLSKSTMHRLLSQMGQLECLDPDFAKAIREDTVPNGTSIESASDALASIGRSCIR
jgi:transposase-like protein